MADVDQDPVAAGRSPWADLQSASTGWFIASGVADEVSEMSAPSTSRQRSSARMRSAARKNMCELRSPPFADSEILPRVRAANRRVRERGVIIWIARDLHAQASGPENPELQGGARRRAQAGHGAVRRSQGLDGAAGRPRPRGGAQAPRPGARTHDGGRPSLRGHRQSGGWATGSWRCSARRSPTRITPCGPATRRLRMQEPDQAPCGGCLQCPRRESARSASG